MKEVVCIKAQCQEVRTALSIRMFSYHTISFLHWRVKCMFGLQPEFNHFYTKPNFVVNLASHWESFRYFYSASVTDVLLASTQLQADISFYWYFVSALSAMILKTSLSLSYFLNLFYDAFYTAVTLFVIIVFPVAYFIIYQIFSRDEAVLTNRLC